ncbi:hypothetical protein [Azospirillum sp. TSO22-1]|uniref:hypothetical protein n=1 Tax=Azospirillum sp. TSO22-1 TaxID=716789 RepID=UPI000D60F487|nr:hypothetical protein [Azospirillum sp. TSO22-1]PWC53619.1 hypothetical protein TSO221_10345 [Azospirillum sp. TSO22-1]
MRTFSRRLSKLEARHPGRPSTTLDLSPLSPDEQDRFTAMFGRAWERQPISDDDLAFFDAAAGRLVWDLPRSVIAGASRRAAMRAFLEADR